MYVVQHRLAISASLLRNCLLTVKKFVMKREMSEKRKVCLRKLDASKRQCFSLEVSKNVLLKAPLKSIWWDTCKKDNSSWTVHEHRWEKISWGWSTISSILKLIRKMIFSGFIAAKLHQYRDMLVVKEIKRFATNRGGGLIIKSCTRNSRKKDHRKKEKGLSRSWSVKNDKISVKNWPMGNTCCCTTTFFSSFSISPTTVSLISLRRGLVAEERARISSNLYPFDKAHLPSLGTVFLIK